MASKDTAKCNNCKFNCFITSIALNFGNCKSFEAGKKINIGKDKDVTNDNQDLINKMHEERIQRAIETRNRIIYPGG